MRLWQERLLQETGGVIPSAKNQSSTSSPRPTAPQTEPEPRRGLFGRFGRKKKPADAPEPMYAGMPKVPPFPVVSRPLGRETVPEPPPAHEPPSVQPAPALQAEPVTPAAPAAETPREEVNRPREAALAAQPASAIPKTAEPEQERRRGVFGMFSGLKNPAKTQPKPEGKTKSTGPREEFQKGDGPGRVITFWSPKSEGATTTALGVAQELARRGKRVWLFDLNFRRPSIGDCLEPNLTLTGWDTLWPQLQAGTLTADHIDAVLWKPKKSFTMAPILGGLSHTEYAANFLPDAIERLISVAQTRCEYVIIDVGADLDNAGTEACLRNNYLAFVVLRPVWLSLKTYRDAQRILNLLGIDHSRFKLVITSRREDGAYTNKEVERFCGNPVAVTVPYYPELDKAFGMCVFPDQLDRTKEQAEYLAAMRNLADLITAR